MTTDARGTALVLTSLAQLRAFVAAADLGSFTKAAQQLRITQPAISILIRRLEVDLEVSLINRSGGEFLLTEAGRRLLPHALQAVDAARRGVDAVRPSGSDDGVERPPVGDPHRRPRCS